MYLFVEVEEAFGAVDVVEGREGLDGAVDAHGVEPDGAARGDQHPVRRRPTDEHLRTPGVMESCLVNQKKKKKRATPRGDVWL